MTIETHGRNILATELLKDGYHERAERVAAGNERMSDEPAVRACVEAVGERPNVSARELLAAELDMPHLSTRVREASADAGVFITPSQALRAIEAALALPSPVRQGEDGGGIGGLREELRVLMLEQPISGTRETYSDGFAQGLCHAIWRIDALPAISPVRESVLEEAAKVADDIGVTWGLAYSSMTDVISAAIRALKSDPDFTGHIDCPEDEGGSDHAD